MDDTNCLLKIYVLVQTDKLTTVLERNGIRANHINPNVVLDELYKIYWHHASVPILGIEMEQTICTAHVLNTKHHQFFAATCQFCTSILAYRMNKDSAVTCTTNLLTKGCRKCQVGIYNCKIHYPSKTQWQPVIFWYIHPQTWAYLLVSYLALYGLVLAWYILFSTKTAPGVAV